MNRDLAFDKTGWNWGFTLIELMVVISIIAILVTIGLSSFSTAQRKARDAKRKTDIRSLQAALEQYYSICGYGYPTPAGGFYGPVICTTPGVSVALMPTGITDPLGTNPYFCPTPVVTNCSAASYSICARLESETPNNFCVSNAQ